MGAVIGGPFPANLFRRRRPVIVAPRALSRWLPRPVASPVEQVGPADWDSEPPCLRDWREAETRDD